MRQLTFDTPAFVNELRKSGFPQEEAEGLARASSKVFGLMVEARELATKKDLLMLEGKLIRWIAGTGAVLFVAFAALLVGILVWL